MSVPRMSFRFLQWYFKNSLLAWIFTFFIVAVSATPVFGDISIDKLLPNGAFPNLVKTQTLKVPASFQVDYTLAAIGFHPNKQAQLEKGLGLFQTVCSQSSRCKVIEIPIIDLKFKRFEGAVEGFMKKSVIKKDWMPLIYPIYTEPAAVKRMLKLQNNQDFAFILINTSGKVIWQNNSEQTVSTVNQVRQKLQ